ncbi:MAG TPA: hypothetical protein VN783_09040, partial [Thermoanaerobaculia bacterium]|nr:hypothetical protein [Thermoanaerobaculia bacterium]
RPRTATLIALAAFALAAVLVKQNAIVYCAAFAIGLLLCVGFRRAAVFAGLTGGALGLAVLVLQISSHGWFWFYTVLVPRSHGLDADRMLASVVELGVGKLPIAWLALPGLAAFARNGPSLGVASRRRTRVALAVLLGASFLADLGMSGHLWGFLNVHMPLHACLVIGAAATTPALLRAIGGSPTATSAWLLLALALQAWATNFKIDAQIPTPEARADSERVVAAIAATPGRILASEFPYLLFEAGKPVCFHISAVADLALARENGASVDLEPVWREARSTASLYVVGQLGVPFALKGEFPPFRIEPFGADAPGWPPATGMHTRPTGWVRRQGG